MDELSKVYIKIDARNRIIAVEGGYTINNIKNIDNWIYIDAGIGDRYNLCQTHYLPMPLIDENCVYRYKFVNGEIIERTDEERMSDIELEEANKSVSYRLTELETVIDILLNGEAGEGDA